MASLAQIQGDMTAALKSGDWLRLSALRMLLSGVRNLGIAKYGAEVDSKLNDSDVIDVIKKQVKMHRQSIEAFEKGGRQDLVDKEKTELAILEAYLPK